MGTHKVPAAMVSNSSGMGGVTWWDWEPEQNKGVYKWG